MFLMSISFVISYVSPMFSICTHLSYVFSFVWRKRILSPSRFFLLSVTFRYSPYLSTRVVFCLTNYLLVNR